MSLILWTWNNWCGPPPKNMHDFFSPAKPKPSRWEMAPCYCLHSWESGDHVIWNLPIKMLTDTRIKHLNSISRINMLKVWLYFFHFFQLLDGFFKWTVSNDTYLHSLQTKKEWGRGCGVGWGGWGGMYTAGWTCGNNNHTKMREWVSKKCIVMMDGCFCWCAWQKKKVISLQIVLLDSV